MDNLFLTIQECETIVKLTSTSNQPFGIESVQLEALPDHGNGWFSIRMFLSSAGGLLEKQFWVKQLINVNIDKEMIMRQMFVSSKVEVPEFVLELIWHKEKVMVFNRVENCIIAKLEHIKLAVKTLAEFHAAYLNKSKQLVQDYPHLQFKLNCSVNKIKELVDKFPQNNISKEDIEKKLYQILNVETSDKSLKGFCLEDVSLNNFLSYSNDKETSCKIKSINSNYSSLTENVLMLIYSNTDAEMRKVHLQDLLRLYYENLRYALKHSGQELIQSFDDFQVSVKEELPKMKVSLFFIQNCIQNEIISEILDVVTHEHFLLEDISQIVFSKLKNIDYKILDYTTEDLKEISGYLGDHKKLQIEVLTQQKKLQIKCFAKFIPQNPTQRRLVMESDVFFKEHFCYHHLIPAYREMGLDIIDEITVPCHFTRKDDVMVFEDMENLGYKTQSMRQPYNYEILQVVAKQIAKIHACSLIYEERKSKESGKTFRFSDVYPRAIKEAFFSLEEKHAGTKGIEVGVAAVEHQIELFQKPDWKISLDEFKAKSKKAFEHFYNLMKPSKTFRNVICHGDLWTTNLLLKHEKDSLVDCRIIDYQLIRYCPPSHDLLSCIYFCSDRNTRSKYLNALIDLYYDELTKITLRYGLKLTDVYSYDTFIKSCEYIKPQAICQCVLMFHLTTVNSDYMKEYMVDPKVVNKVFLEDRRDFITDMCSKDPIYRNRMEESIEDLRELCEKHF